MSPCGRASEGHAPETNSVPQLNIELLLNISEILNNFHVKQAFYSLKLINITITIKCTSRPEHFYLIFQLKLQQLAL
jgi:hypothetical protein